MSTTARMFASVLRVTLAALLRDFANPDGGSVPCETAEYGFHPKLKGGEAERTEPGPLHPDPNLRLPPPRKSRAFPCTRAL